MFSITWIEVSGQSANDVAKQLRDQQYFLAVRCTASPRCSLPPSPPARSPLGTACCRWCRDTLLAAPIHTGI